MWLAAMSLGLGFAACGGSNDVARPTGPVKKVAWDGSDAPAEEAPAAEEAEEKSAAKAAPAKKEEAAAEAESGDLEAGSGAIDLDALPAKAAAKPAPRAQPEPKPEEPVAAEEEEAAEEPVAKAEPEPEAPSNDPLAAELRKRRAQAKQRSEAKKDEEKAPRKKKAKPASSEAEAAAASYKGSDPCRAASFSVARVREACASGGRAAAKRVMKDAIGKATATGQLLKCSDCHENQKDYSLKSKAVADLKRWLDS